MHASGFSWFQLIPAIDHDVLLDTLGMSENHIVAGHEVANTAVHLHAWLACFLILGFAVLARMGLEKVKSRQGMERFFTSETLNPVTAAEIFVTGIKGMMGDLLSERDVRSFMPYIGGLFAYIFVCNIMGIIPGFSPPTSNINTNVGMALSSFLVFNFIGLSRDAKGYIKHLMGPVLLLAPFMFPLEVISLVIRPISLTVRLTANLFGDHQVFVLLSDMIPVFLPVALLGLACMVSVIQAFVFSLLSVIYISLSLPHHDHDEAHAH